MKKIVSLVLALMMVFALTLAFTSCGEVKDLKKIEKNGKIVVGITNYYPMDFIGEDDESWDGFDAQLATKFAEELGVDVQFVLIKWDNKSLELKSGNIDLIWNGMTVTDKLAEEMDFSVSYAENKQVAVIRKEKASAINSKETLKNAKIAVEQGSAGASAAKDELGATNVSELSAQVNALLEVKAGTSDACIIDYTMAYGLVGKGDYADLMIVDTDAVSFEREEFAVGLRKGSDLTEKLNEFLKKCYKDGTLASLASKYNGAIALNDEKLSK